MNTPSNVTIEVTQDSITLKWDAVTHATGYSVLRNFAKVADTVATEYTDADAVAYHTYVYEIRAYNAEDVSSPAVITAAVTPPVGFTLITDRTASDVLYARDLLKRYATGDVTPEEALAVRNGLRGAYTAFDLNRVESAVAYIQDYLNSVQSTLNAYRDERQVAADKLWDVPWAQFALRTRTDWTVIDPVTLEETSRYLENIDNVTSALPIDKALPTSMERFTYTHANALEEALDMLYALAVEYERERKHLIENAGNAYFYSDEIYSGEV